MKECVLESTDALSSEMLKRGRGRPRKTVVESETVEKRGRGRPRKSLSSEESTVKRGRGRPRKYPIAEKELLPNGEIRPSFKKVDSAHLLKHMLNYFTKLLILHGKLAQESHKFEMVFTRLKQLDFQMAEICKTVLEREYAQTSEESNEQAA